jgi:hypothetical protein
MSNQTKDWREDFYEVRVCVLRPVEFVMPLKANDVGDAVKEAVKMLGTMNEDDIVAQDTYGKDMIYDSADWRVINIKEAFGLENTPKDFQEAKRCAWNVEDES